jgi:hypothetical protein
MTDKPFPGWSPNIGDKVLKASIERGEITKHEFAHFCGFTLESVIANFDKQVGDVPSVRLVTPATMDAARNAELGDSDAPRALP